MYLMLILMKQALMSLVVISNSLGQAALVLGEIN